MTHDLTFAIINTAGSVLTAGLSALAVWYGNRNHNKITDVASKVDGKLDKTIGLLQDKAFSAGQDQQRDLAVAEAKTLLKESHNG